MFYWKTETNSSLSMEICGTRRQGGICLAHTWQLSQTEHRGSPNSDILCLRKLRRGKCSYFMQEPFMVALLGGDAFLRTEYIPFWKLSGPGDTCGKNFSSLADGEPNPFSLNLDSLPSLGRLTHPLFLENLSCVLAKRSCMSSTLCTLQGLAGHRTLGNASIPFLAWPPLAQIFPEDALKNLVCHKK